MTSHSKIGRRRLVDEYIEIVFARFLHAKEEAGRQGDVKKGIARTRAEGMKRKVNERKRERERKKKGPQTQLGGWGGGGNDDEISCLVSMSATRRHRR